MNWTSPGPTASRLWLLLAVAVLLALSGCVATPGSGADQTTIQFEAATQESGIDYTPIESGGFGNGNEGLYAADVDNDGWQDVLAMGGERPALFTNENGTFERSGALSSLEHEYRTATFVDYDGDGWRDLVVLGADREVVAFHNDGGTLRRTDLGLGNVTYPTGAAAADFDGDGDEDLFVYQSGSWRVGKPEGYFKGTGRIAQDNGNPNLLFENVDGEFRRVDDSGLTGNHWSLAASAVDLNDDGATDIHVANDFYFDEVYLNRGDGTFEHRYLGNRTARNGMSSEVADADGDGSPDVFVTNIYLPVRDQLSQERYDRYKRFLDFVIHSGRTKGNTLMLNDGTGGLTDSAEALGVRKGGWGWAASFADYDNDRDRDLMHTTQYVLQLNRSSPHYTYPMLFERTGSGFRTLDASDHGLEERDGRGMVSVDYDNDGDLEVMTINYAQNVTVYDNVGTTGNALQFTVRSDDGGAAMGSVVTVTADGESTVVRQTDRTDFLSQEPLVRHVGLGDADSADVHVRWPDGTERTFEDVPADRRLTIWKDGVETARTFDEGEN